MGLPLIETVLDELAAVLVAGMADKVAVINAEYDDAYRIAEPSATKGYYVELEPPSRADISKLSKPAVCIFPNQSVSTRERPDLSNAYSVKHHVDVAVVVAAGSRAEQSRLVMRATRAVLELICSQGSLACGQCLYGGTDWRQRDLLKQSKPNYLLGSSVSVVAVEAFERP